MKTNKTNQTVTIKANKSTKIQDALIPEVWHYYFQCLTKDIPKNLPSANLRGTEDYDSGIYKEIKESLQSGDNFHLKNQGITILASQINQVDTNWIINFSQDEIGGIVNGGHTYRIINETNKDGIETNEQYVNIHFITGVRDEKLAEEMVECLNTSMKVKETSIANLKGYYDWIKAETKPFEKYIGWVETDKNLISARDIIAFMSVLNIDNIVAPVQPYSTKEFCLKKFVELEEKELKKEVEISSFKKFKPILVDILKLKDYINKSAIKTYRDAKIEKQGHEKGKHKIFKKDAINGKEFEFCFLNEKSKRELQDGVLFPMMYAMRCIIEQKQGDMFFSWKVETLQEVYNFFDKVCFEFLERVIECSESHQNKIQQVGKDSRLYTELKGVAEKSFENYILRLENEKLKANK